MTKGAPVRLLLWFSLPILLGNLLQQLYSLIDTLIIGRLLGVTALTAVTASGWLDWAMLSVPLGLSQGFSIHAAQCFGAGDLKGLKRAVAQSYLIAAAAAALLMALSLSVLHPVLVMMNSPEETIAMTESYLRILYAGIPVVMALNTFSGFLYALGNSRVPLIALACSSFVNIGLDWVFVGPLGWGTDGGAYATVIAQGVSALICMTAVLRIPELRPSRPDYRPDPGRIMKLTWLGSPIVLQNLIISLGGLVLQGVVNAYGFIFMAGYNAAARLQGLIETAGTALGSAQATFTGQNYGAGKMDRVRGGLKKAVLLSLASAVFIGLVMVLFGRPILTLFVHDEAAVVDQVLSIGYDFLLVMSAGLPTLYLLFVYRSTLQGLGETLIPMMSGGVELVMRVGGALLLPKILGLTGVYLAEIMAWAGAGFFLMIFCYRRLRKLQIAFVSSHRG